MNEFDLNFRLDTPFVISVKIILTLLNELGHIHFIL